MLLRGKPITIAEDTQSMFTGRFIMSISSVSAKSPVSGFDTKSVSASANSSATALQNQISTLQKKIQVEKLSKSDNAKTRANRLAQYNFQLQQLEEQLAKAQPAAQ